MRTLRLLATAVAIGAFAGCGSDSEEPSTENLSGLWNATAMVFTSVENTAVRVDVIAQGATFEINLNDSGGFAATLTLPGEAPETLVGTWSYTNDTLTLQETGASFALVFDLNLGNDQMTLTGADVEYDFDDDEVDEPATLTIDLVRD
jgi:hypothetical protein